MTTATAVRCELCLGSHVDGTLTDAWWGSARAVCAECVLAVWTADWSGVEQRTFQNTKTTGPRLVRLVCRRRDRRWVARRAWLGRRLMDP